MQQSRDENDIDVDDCAWCNFEWMWGKWNVVNNLIWKYPRNVFVLSGALLKLVWIYDKKKKRSAKEIKGINKLSNALKEKEIVWFSR